MVVNDDISVNDGTADTAFLKNFKNFVTFATRLNIPNARSINWTLLVATNSDSAAMQKKLNKLIEEHQRN